VLKPLTSLPLVDSTTNSKNHHPQICPLDLPLRLEEIAALIKQESLQIHDYQEAMQPPQKEEDRETTCNVDPGFS